MPRSPRSPILRHSAAGNWFDRSISAARGAISFAANCWTVARSMSTSSPSAKLSEGKFSTFVPPHSRRRAVPRRELLPLRASQRPHWPPRPQARGRSSAVCLAMHDDQRLLHQRDERPLVPCFCMHLSASDRQRPTCLNHVTFGEQTFAGRRRKQVQLELDGEHRAVLGKQREARVTAR